MKNLYIVGAGGCGREILSLLLDIHQIAGPRWRIRGFLDDTPDPLAGRACDAPVAGSIIDYAPAPDDELVMAVADPGAKYRLVSMLKTRGAAFASVIHPHATLGRHCELGEGVVVQSGFSMTVNVRIGAYATLLASCLGHDVRVGDYSTIASHCNIAGNVVLGRRVFVGGSVAIAPRVRVGDDAYLCMGSVVLRHVEPGCKILGNPGRPVGEVALP